MIGLWPILRSNFRQQKKDDWIEFPWMSQIWTRNDDASIAVLGLAWGVARASKSALRFWCSNLTLYCCWWRRCCDRSNSRRHSFSLTLFSNRPFSAKKHIEANCFREFCIGREEKIKSWWSGVSKLCDSKSRHGQFWCVRCLFRMDEIVFVFTSITFLPA